MIDLYMRIRKRRKRGNDLEPSPAAGQQLLLEYKKLCPELDRVYVIPDIEKFSRHNHYLYLLYKDFIENNELREIRLTSFSVLSPAIVWRKLRGERSLLHHHWFEFHDLRSFLNVLWKIFWIALYKLAGGKVVWTIHNINPHEKKFRFLNKAIRRVWSKIPDKFHVHCQKAREIISPVLAISLDRFFIVAHPPYPAEIMDRQKALELLRRKYLPELDSSSTIFLMFGYIAEYKGILEVIEIFKNLGDSKVLLVAGPVKRNNKKYFESMANLAGRSRNILLIEKYIPEEDVAIFLNACDCALFNFSDILSSGGVELALGYHKKIIIPNKGCLEELEGEGIYKFGNRNELRNILEQI